MRTIGEALEELHNNLKGSVKIITADFNKNVMKWRINYPLKLMI
ncbi:hypothetical protein [Rickettsia tamurae]|nr:hypothetical protein [Rickettsia tamurae]